MHARRTAVAAVVTITVLAASLTACNAGGGRGGGTSTAHASAVDAGSDGDAKDTKPSGAAGVVTLAFAGDMHFELHLAALLAHPRGALGPITKSLAGADLTMVNLESSISHRGAPDPKELEQPDNRYYFRTSPAALDVLAAAGVDVVTMANNHGADYGRAGLQDTLRAIRRSPVHVVGVGADRHAAFTPYRASVRGTTFAFFGADASFREGSSSVWAAGPNNAGLAVAHAGRPRALLAAVRTASRGGDVVVVYLHWGEELHGCPTTQQRIAARALADAGADIVVGSHAHVLLGSGWIGDTYVDYGLGNFLWYHDHQPETGVLRLGVRDGHVVDDAFTPARIGTDGRPRPLTGPARVAALADWHGLRGCTGLAPRPAGRTRHHASPAPYTASVRPIGPRLRVRMRSTDHPGCPTGLNELRYLRMTYLGFDGAAHVGEMVVHKKYAAAVVDVFHRLYDARWPIQRMRLVDDYDGDDEASMAANNTSGYNCRRIAGRQVWSDHAFGAAIDINPAQNPYISATGIHPRSAARLATIPRTRTSLVPAGAIRDGDIVVRSFAQIGWAWGGHFATHKDYQHFYAAGP
jgi:hypothetical protein